MVAGENGCMREWLHERMGGKEDGGRTGWLQERMVWRREWLEERMVQGRGWLKERMVGGEDGWRRDGKEKR